MRLDQLRGTIQNDILKEFIAQKEFIFPPEPSMRLVVDTMEFGSQKVPQWNTISISGYHIREAGSTAAQELAFTLGDGLEYVRWGIARGMDVDEFAPRLSFFFNAHNDFFEEIAKYRAARRIWAREMRETFKAKNPRSWLLRFHTQTAGVSLTAQQPENNVVRVALQALAAVLGGTQSLHTNGYDEALSLPTAEAAKTALRTQQIIGNESGLTATVDPLGGSYYVEYLTNEIERKAKEYIDKIEEMGGAVRAIENHYIQNEIANASYEYQKQIEKNEKIIVGVNKFLETEKNDIPLLKIDDSIRSIQTKKLQALKNERDGAKANQALLSISNAAKNGENIMPTVIHAVEQLCTLGEIADTLRAIYGEYKG